MSSTAIVASYRFYEFRPDSGSPKKYLLAFGKGSDGNADIIQINHIVGLVDRDVNYEISLDSSAVLSSTTNL